MKSMAWENVERNPRFRPYNGLTVTVELGKGLCPLESPVGSLRNLNEINGLGKRERNPRFRPYNGLETIPDNFPR